MSKVSIRRNNEYHLTNPRVDVYVEGNKVVTAVDPVVLDHLVELWTIGRRKIAAVKHIRSECRCSLTEAKAIAEQWFYIRNQHTER